MTVFPHLPRLRFLDAGPVFISGHKHREGRELPSVSDCIYQIKHLAFTRFDPFFLTLLL